MQCFVGPTLASSMERSLGETSILTTNTSLDHDAEKTRWPSKDPITTSSNQRLTKARRWVRLPFFPLLKLYFHTCAAMCCVLCVSVPREGVMRTSGARLKNRGSLTEKWAEAPTLPAASDRQSCSSAWQPRHHRPALQHSATCTGNFMPWRPWPPLANQYQPPEDWATSCGCLKHQDKLLRV